MSLKSDEALFTVSRINQAIGAALAEAFPDPFWVVGEIQGYERDAARAGQRRWGQVYFELMEKEPGADAARASVKLFVWGDVHQCILDKFGRTAALQDGLEVKLLCVTCYIGSAIFPLLTSFSLGSTCTTSTRMTHQSGRC